jgi:hypothetical protein
VPRTDVLSTNFSGGELSPRLYGRPDLAKYADSVKQARDVVMLQHGGATGRPGTDYLGEVKDSSAFTRLVPFVRSVDDAYVLEFGNAYMRVWKDGAIVGGGTPFEISTPYATADLDALDYTQGADTMFLALQSVTPYRLRRYADNAWTMDAAPFDPAPFAEVGRLPAATLTLSSAAVGAATATAGSASFLAADVGRTITRLGGSATITGFTSTTVVDVTVTGAFSSASIASGVWRLNGSPRTTCTASASAPVGASVSLVLAANGWRSDDVGSFVRLNGGIVKITGYTDALTVTGTIVTELKDTTAAPSDAWSLESAVWTSGNGYPRTLTLHQQRLVAAGSATYPQTIWGSRSGLYLDFTKGTADDDSYSFELGSDEINPIRFLSSNRDLLALTYGGEWTLNGGIEKPITPTNIRAVPQAKVGCADVRPEQIDDDLYYVQRGVSMVRTLGWSLQLGGYQSGEASTMSEHLARDGLQQISYQQSPDRMAWLTRDDGTYLAMTVSREQNVRAITLCTPAGGGVVESMATIPEDGEDRTYMIVRRTINGATKRYVERMNWDAHQDCRVTSSPASATITGLSHLALRTVSVVADGVDMGDFTVTAGGQVTLPRSVATASVGLRYVPTIKMLPAETGTGMGASAGRSKLTGRALVLFHETVGASVNGQSLPFRQFGEDVVGTSVQPFSGWKDVSDFGWGVDSDEIEITQPQSYPFTVLAVVRRITSNAG